MIVCDPQTENYRLSRFMSLCFSVGEAHCAIADGIDWHDAQKLTAQGCEPKLALRILAPIN